MRALRRLGVLGILAPMFLLCSMSAVIANPDIGTGVLYVYTDPERTTLAQPDAEGHYLVEIGVKYYFRVLGITEFDVGDLLTVKVGWTDTSNVGRTTLYYNVPVQGDGTKYVDIDWTVPAEAQVCKTGTVHYRGASGPEYVANNGITMIPGHFHVIPENYLGPLGVLGAGALAMVAFATVKRRSIKTPRIT